MQEEVESRKANKENENPTTGQSGFSLMNQQRKPLARPRHPSDTPLRQIIQRMDGIQTSQEWKSGEDGTEANGGKVVLSEEQQKDKEAIIIAAMLDLAGDSVVNNDGRKIQD